MESHIYFKLLNSIRALKYALDTNSKFDFVKASSRGNSLFVGEGNLSFSLEIALQLESSRHKSFWATTFESASEWSDETEVNANKLLQLDCNVLDDFDACSIERRFISYRFDLIVFQFPNVASRSPLYGRNPNHVLLRRFLSSAASSITRNGMVCVTTINSPFYDGAFSVDEAAEWAGLQKPCTYAFDPDDYSIYNHVNTLDHDESALDVADDFVTYVFTA